MKFRDKIPPEGGGQGSRVEPKSSGTTNSTSGERVVETIGVSMSAVRKTRKFAQGKTGGHPPKWKKIGENAQERGRESVRSTPPHRRKATKTCHIASGERLPAGRGEGKKKNERAAMAQKTSPETEREESDLWGIKRNILPILKSGASRGKKKT